MYATLDDAFLLFQKWKEHASRLEIKLRSSALIFEAAGVVIDFSPAALQLAGETWSFTIPLPGAAFSFSDPREIPIASVRAAESKLYEFGLAVDLPNGDRLAVMELKAED